MSKWNLIFILASFATLASAQPPALLLAETYQPSAGDAFDVREFWVSEKLDGVRAYWDGTRLLSRQGNIFNPPEWFTADFPPTPMDGELWIARQRFEAVVSTVKTQQPQAAAWREVGFYVFELPHAPGDFSQRVAAIKQLVAASTNPYLYAVEQFRLESTEQLLVTLDRVIESGGEGLMLHRQDSTYHSGRSNALLKLKPYQDADALVIGHTPGKGRHHGRLGALIVQMPNKKQFRIGSGFSDAERDTPPPIGSTVTYKYYGLTKNGIPRFASFLRVRK